MKAPEVGLKVEMQQQQHKPGDAVCVVIQPYANLTMSWVVPSLDATHITISVSASINHVSTSSAFGTYVHLPHA